MLKKDMVYYEMTNGGITFGGGEPLLQTDYIVAFHWLYPEIDIAIETSLNVPRENVKPLLEIASQWFIDIKDIDRDIYYNYTGMDNSQVLANLHMLSERYLNDKICIRIPKINGFNNDDNINNSINYIKKLGFTNIDVFEYEVN